MKFKEIQKMLDKIKWSIGEEIGQDPSGSMDYCAYCKFSDSSDCTRTQVEREKNTDCARANRDMRKAQRGN